MGRKSRKTEKVEQRTLPDAPLVVPYAVVSLSRAKDTTFDIQPNASKRAEIARFLGVLDLGAMRLRGKLVPVGKDRWRAEGRLTANLRQACVATLDPVPERVNETVSRDYIPLDDGPLPTTVIDIDSADSDEDEPDIFGDTIDLGQFAVEALALAMSAYPRAESAAEQDLRVAAPGVEPLSDDDVKPFAALAALKDKLGGPGS